MKVGPLRPLAAEALGTGLLVMTVVGSGMMAQRLTADAGIALLANALATAAALAVLIAILAPVSGAEFNPAVTLAFRRGRAARTVAARIAAQVAGAAAGTILAHAMFGATLVQTGTAARGGPGPWLSEGVATAGLVLTIAGAAGRPALPVLVAGWIGAACWATASTAFANPAVTLARALTGSFAGIRPGDVPAFVLAQLAGAAAGAALARFLFAGRPAVP